MTKRILALLLAVLFAVSCCMMTACGDDSSKTNDGDDKTQTDGNKDDSKTPANDDKDKDKDNNTSDKVDDNKTSPDDDDNKTSEPVALDPSDEFEGELLGFDFYSGAPFEAWCGSKNYAWWQAVMSLSPDEMNFVEEQGLGTDDYPWTWVMNIRPVDAKLNDDPADDAWTSVTCQLDTSTTAGDNILYRLQFGTGFEKLFVVDSEYEMVITVTGADGNYKSGTIIFTWDQKYEDQYQNWKANTCQNDTGTHYESFVPEGAPHDGLTATPRAALSAS